MTVRRPVRIPLSIVLICLLSPAAAPAQEANTFNELLAWFPAYDCSQVYRYDRQAVEETPGGALYRDYFSGRKPFISLAPLPEGLEQAWRSWTVAQVARYRVRPLAKEHEYGEDEVVRTINGKHYGYAPIGQNLYVFRMDAARGAVARAIAAGALKPADESFMELPIYQFSWKERGTSDAPWFAYDTGMGALLVAADRADLIHMAAAGFGQEDGLIDLPEYAEMRALDIDPGNVVQVINFSAANRVELRLMRNFDAQKEELEKTERSFEQMNNVNSSGWIIGEELHRRVLYVCSSPERARSVHERLYSKKPENAAPAGESAGARVSALLLKLRETRITGPVIIIDRSITRELLDLLAEERRERPAAAEKAKTK